MEETEKRLKELTIEDFIWVIYIGIIILSFYSNSIERKFFIYKNSKDKEKYQKINIIIFSILLVVYLYFFKGAIDELNNLKESDDYKKKKLVYLSFIATLLITISGITCLCGLVWALSRCWYLFWWTSGISVRRPVIPER